MSLLLDKDNLKRELSRTMRELKTSFDELEEQSWTAAVNALEPGAPVPKRGRIYGADFIKEFNEKCNALRAKADRAVDQFMRSAKATTATAPSPEAIRSIQMAERIDPDAIGRDVYGDMLDAICQTHTDMMTFEAARSLATRAGIHDFIEPHESTKALRARRDIPRNVSHFFTGHHLTGGPNDRGISDGEIAFFVQSIGGLIDDI